MARRGRDDTSSTPPGETPSAGRGVHAGGYVDEIQRIVRLVGDGASVDLVGGRWSGRSEVLRQVREALVASGRDVLMVRGTDAPQQLEAVRVALPPVYRDATRPGRAAPSITDALREYLAETPAVVMVDDSDLLDEGSRGALVSAYRALENPIVSSRLNRARVDRSADLLVEFAHPVVQVSLRGLRLGELHGVLEQRVQGPLSPAVTAQIHTRSAGIVGLAVAQFDGAVADGLVRRTGRSWTAGPELWSDGARSAYELSLHTYRPELRDALELLALAGTMDLTTAWVLLGETLVEELEWHQLVRLSSVGADSRPVLGVHPPGIADYFLDQPVSARRYRILQDAMSRLTGSEAVAGLSTWARRLSHLNVAGVGGAAARAGASDRGALRSADVPGLTQMFAEAHTLETMIAREEWEATGDCLSAVRYLQLQLTGDADPEVVERVLAEVRHDDGTDPQSEVLLLYLNARWSVIQGVPAAEAVRLLLDAVHEGFVHNGALDSLARAIVYECDALDPAYAQVLGPRAAGEGFDAQVAGVVLAGCHLMAGRVEESARVLDALETPSSRVGAVMETSAGVMRGISLYATGQFAKAYQLAVDGAQRAISDLNRMAFAGYSYVGALAQVALGNFEGAQDALAVVLSAGIVSRPMTFAPDRAILVLMAVISTRTGHEGAAASFVEHAAQVVGTTDALPFGSTGWAEAVAVAGSGQSDVAARVFADVTVDAHARGFHLAGDVATMSSLLVHFDPELAEEFRGQAESLGGGLYGAQLDARAAAHDRDPLRLEAAARAVHERGAASDALTYLTLAVRLFREQGIPDGAARAQSAAHSVASALGVPGHLVAGLGEPEFTARERELIQLVAAGRSNAEIAAQLFIGLRTVESHLRNIRRKSGAGERQDIADLA